MESAAASVASGDCLQEISKRLQDGCVLLSLTCPMSACHTPLLKDAQGEVYCVKCQMYCITEDKARSLPVANTKATSSDPVSEVASNDQFVDPLETSTTSSSKPPIPMPASTSKEAARATADARMGEKLLLGWTMLADMCPTPDCCFPLMLDRDGDTTCVRCGGDGLPVQSDPDPAPNVQKEIPIRAPMASVTASSESKHDLSDGGVLSSQDFAAVRKRRDALSAALGQLMLQGWSLLEETCPRVACEPGTPLLKDRNTGKIYCAGCDTFDRGRLVGDSPKASPPKALPVKRGSSGENRSMSKKEDLTSVGEVESMQVESEYETAEKARLRKQAARERSGGALSPSAGLAERLLQGWTMLSTACPNPGCHNPLMRDKTGAEICVTCGTPANAKSGSKAAMQAEDDLMEEEDEDNREMLDGFATGQAYTERRRAELSAESAVDPVRIKAMALDALYRAIDVSQQRLRSCTGTASVNAEESARQADLITKFAIAARALGDLHARCSSSS